MTDPDAAGTAARRIEALQRLLASGQDDAVLRFGLGNAYLNVEDYAQAADHLGRAVALDPGYSAAWKRLGKALSGLGARAQAVQAYRHGIEAARQHGDLQAVREMEVFVRRLEAGGAKEGNAG